MSAINSNLQQSEEVRMNDTEPFTKFPPMRHTEDKTKDCTVLNQANDIISFLTIIYEGKESEEIKIKDLKRSAFQGSISLGLEDVLDELKILAKEKFLNLTLREFRKLICSEKVLELAEKAGEIKSLLSYKKIDHALRKKISNLFLTGVEYEVEDNQYVYFYYYNQPNKHLITQLNYAYVLFRGDESPEEIEEINNYWLVCDEQNQARSPEKKVIKTIFGSPHLTRTSKKLGPEDLYKTIEQIFIEENMTSNFLQCTFYENGGNAVSPKLWSYCRYPLSSLRGEKKTSAKNLIYESKYDNDDELEKKYTPVLYDIKISFYKTSEQLGGHPFYERKIQPPKYFAEILETLRINPPDYQSSALIGYNYCVDCKTLKYCGKYSDCEDVPECRFTKCKCSSISDYYSYENSNESSSDQD